MHEAGGLIAAQLWHVGRVSHESFHDGGLPVSASAQPYRNRTTVRGVDGSPTRAACPTPRALALDEIPRLLEDFRRATVNARAAGFDLVEIHGAHGYLLHQFLAADANLRTDEYGGTLANRARLMLEVVDAVADAWSSDRVGIRISPIGSFNGTEDPEGAEPGLYVAPSSAVATWRSCTSPSPTGPADRPSTTTTAPPCAPPSPVRSWGPATTTPPRRPACSTPVSSTPPPSAARSSRTPTCRAASVTDCRSTRSGRSRSTAATGPATPTTRRTAPPEGVNASCPTGAGTYALHDMQDFPPRIATFFTGTGDAPTPAPDTRSPAAFLRWMLRQQWQVIALSTLACLLWLMPLTFGPYIFGRAVDQGILAGSKVDCWHGRA